MQTILITGGTGLIGTALHSLLLEKGYHVIVLSRNSLEGSKEAGQGLRFAHWDPKKGEIDPDAIAQADHIIHLAGAGVADKRWTAARKKEIQESRTTGSALIAKTLTNIPNKVQTVISASAIGWYGADPSIPNPRPFVETDPADADFLGETCRLWEEAIAPVTELGKRLVILRTGLALSSKGGPLVEFKAPLKFGVAPILGNGDQMLSWIHIEDLCRLFVESIERKDWQGIYNAVAPDPVNNRTLTCMLAKRLKGKYFLALRVPAFMVKIVLGGLSIEVLKSATVSAEKVKASGFSFLYPTIDKALDNLVLQP